MQRQAAHNVTLYKIFVAYWYKFLKCWLLQLRHSQEVELIICTVEANQHRDPAVEISVNMGQIDLVCVWFFWCYLLFMEDGINRSLFWEIWDWRCDFPASCENLCLSLESSYLLYQYVSHAPLLQRAPLLRSLHIWALANETSYFWKFSVLTQNIFWSWCWKTWDPTGCVAG